MGSLCGRTLDRDGPSFLMQPTMSGDGPLPSWDPVCESALGWASPGQERQLGYEQELTMSDGPTCDRTGQFIQDQVRLSPLTR